jgi:candidapepsin
VFTNLSTRLSFDATKSSTFQPAGVTFNASFGLTPNNIFLGQYFQDKVHIGGATLPNMTLAVANVTQTLFDEGFWGIVGLGARLSEAIFNSLVSPFFDNPNVTFPTLYDQLQNHGCTARRAFSIWLNSVSATSGRIIFSGVDTTKIPRRARRRARLASTGPLLRVGRGTHVRRPLLG